MLRERRLDAKHGFVIVDYLGDEVYEILRLLLARQICVMSVG